MISRQWLASVALVGALGGAACGDAGDVGASGATSTPSPCAAGFALDPALDACVEIVPSGECPANTMPEIGNAECQPVGWSAACPEGFERGPSGWGCVDRVPRDACAGATREDIKTGSCVPVGDCNAPFPPAAATFFVDDDGPEDATHMKTLSAAMTAAPAGATIAVEAGAYAEVIEFEKNGVTVVGRCAEKVKFTPPSGPSGPAGRRAGVFVPGKTGVRLSGVSVSGFRGGVLMEDGELTLEDTILDGNDTLGIYLRFGGKATVRRSKVAHVTQGVGDVGSGLVVYDGSTLTLEDSTVVDSDLRHATVDGKGSTLNAMRTVFARSKEMSGLEDLEAGIAVIDGASAKLVESAILDAAGRGLRVDDEGSRAELERSVIRRPRGTLKKSAGLGVWASRKGVARLTESTVTDSPVVGAYAGNGSGTLILERSTILGVPPGQPVEFGRGVSASDSGILEVRDTAVVDCPQSGVGVQFASTATFDRLYVKGSRPLAEAKRDYGGFGLIVENGSKVTITRSSFDGNSLAGITSVTDAETTAEAVLVRGTREIAALEAGSGVQVARNGTLVMTRSSLVANSSEAATIAGGLFSMSASTIHGTVKAGDDRFGHGVAVFAAGRVELDGVAIYDNPSVGLVSDGGQAFVRGGVFARNAVAVHAQGGAAITQCDAAPEDLAGGEMRISSTTRFVANGARVGAGVIGLPKPPIE